MRLIRRGENHLPMSKKWQSCSRFLTKILAKPQTESSLLSNSSKMRGERAWLTRINASNLKKPSMKKYISWMSSQKKRQSRLENSFSSRLKLKRREIKVWLMRPLLGNLKEFINKKLSKLKETTKLSNKMIILLRKWDSCSRTREERA